MDSCADAQLEADLRDAIAAGALDVHYQPIIAIDSGHAVAAEALVRWHHPVLGPVRPDVFIPLAERTGLIDGIGTEVLRRACADARRWPSDCKVAVNLSAVQFESVGLARSVAAILAETRLPSSRLELEITESVLLKSSKANIETLHLLRALGVSIALDDFGTGYSSLSYLTVFPFDKIKIDRSFVREMPQMDVCAAIVCAVANLGRSLSIATTAEGVETIEQLDLLRAAGCTQAQGYLFGRPGPAAQLRFGKDLVPNVSIARDTGLNMRDIMLVRNSFSLVMPMQDVVATLFYDRLFAIAPELRRMFGSDMAAQKRKLMTVLSSCIARLHDMAGLAPVVRELGARHVGYGTRTEHYAFVADALLSALASNLGERFTPEVRAAWTKVYGVLAATMLEGAAANRARSVG